MKNYLTLPFCLIAMIFFPNCKKGPGDGGRASITGKIYSVNYDAKMQIPMDSGYIGGQKVYIIFGDETAVAHSQDSNNDGAFSFEYLREGKYTVYVFSKIGNGQLDSAVVQSAEITGKKQVLELSDFNIKTNKN